MKVLSILLAFINSVTAGLVLLSCVSVSNPGWDELGWLAIRVIAGVLVILVGALTFRDGMRAIGPGKMLLVGILLVLVGTGSAMWGLHLSIVSGDVRIVMILFGGSLALQGIASIMGLHELGGMAV